MKPHPQSKYMKPDPKWTYPRWLDFVPDRGQVHHIIPVAEGGGACGLDNYELLCIQCHINAHKQPQEGHSVMR